MRRSQRAMHERGYLHLAQITKTEGLKIIFNIF